MAANYELGVGKYCFGEFCCSHCGREWESSKAWRDFGQECSKCGSKIKPHNLLALCWYYCVQCEHVWKYKGMEEEVECNVCSEIAFVFETHVEMQQFCTARNLNVNGSGVINQERAHQQDKCEKCIVLGNGRLCYEFGNENLKNPHIPVQLNNGHSVNSRPTKVTISSVSEVRLSNTLKVKKLMANDENVTRKTKQSISSIIGPLSLERASTKMLTFEERREEEARKKQKEAEERQMESEQRRQREAEQRRLEAEQRRQKEAEQRWQMEAEHCRKMEAEQRRKMKAEQRRKIEAEQRRLEAEQRRQEEAEERRQREAEQRRQMESEQRQRRQMESEQRRQRDAAERERYNKNGNANNADGMVVAVAGAVVLISISILRSIFKF